MQGFEREHKRFWRQVILWLAKKDDTDEQKVWLKLAQRRLSAGARESISPPVHARRKEKSLPARRFTATLVLPDGTKRPIPLTRQADNGRELRDVIEPGDYSIAVSASKDGDCWAKQRHGLSCSSKIWKWKTPPPDRS